MTQAKQSEQSVSPLVRMLAALVVFLVGALAGNLAPTMDHRQPEAPPDYTRPITVREEGKNGVLLVPYAVCIEGKNHKLCEHTDGACWVIQYDGPRVQVAYEAREQK